MSSELCIRVSDDVLGAVDRARAGEGVSRSEWVRRVVDAALLVSEAAPLTRPVVSVAADPELLLSDERGARPRRSELPRVAPVEPPRAGERTMNLVEDGVGKRGRKATAKGRCEHGVDVEAAFCRRCEVG